MGFEELAIGILDYTATGAFRSPLRAGKRKVRGREGGREGGTNGGGKSRWRSGFYLVFVDSLYLLAIG